MGAVSSASGKPIGTWMVCNEKTYPFRRLHLAIPAIFRQCYCWSAVHSRMPHYGGSRPSGVSEMRIGDE